MGRQGRLSAHSCICPRACNNLSFKKQELQQMKTRMNQTIDLRDVEARLAKQRSLKKMAKKGKRIKRHREVLEVRGRDTSVTWYYGEKIRIPEVNPQH